MTLPLVLPSPARFGSLAVHRTSATESLTDVGALTVNRGSVDVVLEAKSITTFSGQISP